MLGSLQSFLFVLLIGTTAVVVVSNMLVLYQQEFSKAVVCALVGSSSIAGPNRSDGGGESCAQRVQVVVLLLNAVLSAICDRLWYLPLLTITSIGASQWNLFIDHHNLCCNSNHWSHSFSDDSTKKNAVGDEHRNNDENHNNNNNNNNALSRSEEVELNAAEPDEHHDIIILSTSTNDSSKKSVPVVVSYAATYCEVSSVFSVTGSLFGSYVSVYLLNFLHVSVAGLTQQHTDEGHLQSSVAEALDVQQRAVMLLVLLGTIGKAVYCAFWIWALLW